MAAEVCVRSLPVLLSAKTDPEFSAKCVLVIQVARMAAEVCVRSLPVLKSAKIDPEVFEKCVVNVGIGLMEGHQEVLEDCKIKMNRLTIFKLWKCL